MRKVYESLKKIGKVAAPYAVAIGHTALITGIAIYSGVDNSRIAVATTAGVIVGGLEGLFVRELLKD